MDELQRIGDGLLHLFLATTVNGGKGLGAVDHVVDIIVVDVMAQPRDILSSSKNGRTLGQLLLDTALTVQSAHQHRDGQQRQSRGKHHDDLALSDPDQPDRNGGIEAGPCRNNHGLNGDQSQKTGQAPDQESAVPQCHNQRGAEDTKRDKS